MQCKQHEHSPALIVEATRASGMVMPKLTQARFITVLMLKQKALGLKSDARATGAPASMRARVGGSGSFRR